MPPAQNKPCVLDTPAEDIIKRLSCIDRDMALHKALLQNIQGVSPIVCRELEHLTGRGC